MKSPVTKAVVEAVVMLATHTLAASTFTAFWKRVSPKLEEGLHYIDEHGDGPMSGEKTFLEKITFRDAELTRITNSCLKEFLDGEILDLMRKVQKIQDRTGERKEQINSWRLACVAAPSSSFMPLRNTRRRLMVRIQKEEKAISEDQAAVERLKTEALDRLSARGINMTAEQLDGLLYTAEGAELAQVMTVAENIRAIQEKLGEQLRETGCDAEQVKTYTGLLMMCYRVYITVIERTIIKIRETYLVKLAEITDRAEEQMYEADELRKKSRKASSIARNNAELNGRTLQLADLYRRHLEERSDQLGKLLNETDISYELALNTFHTIKVSGELVKVISSAQKDLQAIFDFKPPQVKAFYDKNLRGEFDRMTRQLREAAR